MAEKAAWDFLAKLPEDEKFEVVTINPSMILGPNMVNGDFTSGQIIAQFMNGKMNTCPKISFPMVDVREVAQAHLMGIKVEEARNKRYILSAESLWFKDMGAILKEKYG